MIVKTTNVGFVCTQCNKSYSITIKHEKTLRTQDMNFGMECPFCGKQLNTMKLNDRDIVWASILQIILVIGLSALMWLVISKLV